MNTERVCQSLSAVLADTYVLMLKTQNVHWNVEGRSFLSIHLLSEEQYNELFAAIDELAERIRALGGTTPGTMKAFMDLTRLSEGRGGNTLEEMAQELYDANTQMARLLRREIEIVDDEDEEGTEDIYIARLQVHEKAAWMWGAIIEKPVQPTSSSSNGKGTTYKNAPKAVPASSTPKKAAPAKAESKPAPKAEVKSEAKAETKTESKVESKPKKAKAKASKKKGRLSRNITGTG